MYPVYVRGLAFLGLGQPDRAAEEFRKIVEHDGIMVSDPMGALSRLHLARALAISGDLKSSRKAYGELLRIWKNADAGMALWLRRERKLGIRQVTLRIERVWGLEIAPVV